MKLAFIPILSVSLCCGCMSSAPKAPALWTIAPKATDQAPSESPRWGVARLAQVSVRAPYDGQRLAVLRKDGSIAFDAFNQFASAPAALLRGAAQDVAASSGLFARVVHGSSSALAPCSLEICVTRLALDCRVEGARDAVCELALLLLDGREIAGFAHGDAAIPAPAGDYSAAFSAAFTTALTEALGKL